MYKELWQKVFTFIKLFITIISKVYDRDTSTWLKLYIDCKQLLDLLAQQSALIRDRQLLSREVEFLRKQIAKSNEEDLEKFFSSNKTLVDDIIENVNCEEMENKYKQKSVINSSEKEDDLIDT